jgi:hypothetical protein
LEGVICSLFGTLFTTERAPAGPVVYRGIFHAYFGVLRWSPFLGQETGLAKRESRRFLVPLPVCGDDASGYHFILIN